MLDLGVNFSPATNLSRDIMGMGPDVFTGSTIGNQPTNIGNNFYQSLTKNGPQITVPNIQARSVNVSQKANLDQNALSSTGNARSDINQTKANFLQTMKEAKQQAGEIIFAEAKSAGVSSGQVAKNIFPNNKSCEALNFISACDPSFMMNIWSGVNDVMSYCSNDKIDLVLQNALAKLHEASKAKAQNGAKPKFDWQDFNRADLQRFLLADPMKDDPIGKDIAQQEVAVSNMEENQGALQKNYDKSGDKFEKVCYALLANDDSLAADLVGTEALKPVKCAAECMAAPAILLGLKGIAADNENTPLLESAPEIGNKLAEAAIKMEPTSSLKKLLEATMNPFSPKFRKAA